MTRPIESQVLAHWVAERLRLPPHEVLSADTELASLPGANSLFFAELLTHMLAMTTSPPDEIEFTPGCFSTIRTLAATCGVQLTL